MLKAISPVDGRYARQTETLQDYFSEFALMRYRIKVEIEYLIALAETGIITYPAWSDTVADQMRRWVDDFSETDAVRIKDIEHEINHDVKAIEYFIKEKLDSTTHGVLREWVHFGLTSQDINNSAFPLMLRDCYLETITPLFESILNQIHEMSTAYESMPMLAYTHGQPASPTRFGKEMRVFADRLEYQWRHLEAIELRIKFGGATGNFNAHHAAFPGTDWNAWGDEFAQLHFGMPRYRYTTQIEPYDEIAALCHATARLNTILIDFCRDIWTYISMQYLTQKANPNEVGSSAMPHKVNPIDFENAEGNLGYANAIFSHLAEKLPISRLQRDLTDSTVLRNIGVPVAHTLIALTSLGKGLKKIHPNPDRMLKDLDHNWAVVAEGIQTILRREGIPNPYELLKDLTRGKTEITKDTIHSFIDTLAISESVKNEMRSLRPDTYTGQ